MSLHCFARRLRVREQQNLIARQEKGSVQVYACKRLAVVPAARRGNRSIIDVGSAQLGRAQKPHQ
jgi:hypothetical protein